MKPKAFKGMKVKKSENVGKNFRTANGAHIPNQGETTIEGRDATGAKLKVVAQVADVTKNLASVMEMVDRGGWVIFHKEGGYIQTTKKDEELNVRTLMNTLKGARAPIARRGTFRFWKSRSRRKKRSIMSRRRWRRGGGTAAGTWTSTRAN